MGQVINPVLGVRFPCLQQTVTSRLGVGVQMLEEHPGGCPQGWLAGSGWQLVVMAGRDQSFPPSPVLSPLGESDAAQPAARGMEFQRLADPSRGRGSLAPWGSSDFPSQM